MCSRVREYRVSLIGPETEPLRGLPENASETVLVVVGTDFASIHNFVGTTESIAVDRDCLLAKVKFTDRPNIDPNAYNCIGFGYNRIDEGGWRLEYIILQERFLLRPL